MFLSQKGSLGRNPMINRVGQRLLQLFEGASAAYSLRDLASNIASVVRVRRASDNSEKDFSAADVSSGAMTQWVNAQIVPPLDVRELVDGERTGDLVEAAAAYSLRNLSASYTGNVVDVRRSSDDAVQSFTAAEVADGTLTTWVNTDVLTYESDFSSGTDGFLTPPSSAPWTCNIDSIGGLNDNLRLTSNYPVVNVNTYFRRNRTLSAGNSHRVTFDAYIPSTNSEVDDFSTVAFGTSQVNIAGQITLDQWTSYDVTGTANATALFIRLKGNSSGDATGDVVYIRNVQITQTTAHGHVTQWYDQSGNGNHATQTDAANQPKIVDAGSLVTGGIDFDGVDDGLLTSSNLTDTLQSATFFAVTKEDTTSGAAAMVRIRPNGAPGTLDGFSWEKVTDDTYGPNTLIEGANGAVSATIAGQGTRNTSKNLNTLIYQQSQILAYENGALDATLNTVRSGSVPVGDVTLVDQLWLGQNFDDNARPFNGTMSEVIIYFTDQSANRTAFEANIGETYGIDLPSGVDTGYDQVDGFVETWYDQSSSVVTNYDPYPSSQFQASGNTSYWSATPTAGTDGTEWDLVSDLGNDSTNDFGNLMLASNYTASKVRVGKHRVEFDLTLNSGVIDNGASSLGDRPLVLVTRDHDDDPTTSAHSRLYEVVEGFNSIDVEVFDDGIEIGNQNFAPSIFLSARPSSVFDVTVSNLEVSHVTEPIVRNGNDAVQETASNQPKIVDAGVLVKRTINGVSSPSVKFTAGNVMTHGLTSLSTDGQQSLFFVSDNQLTSSTSTRLIEIMSNTADEARRRRPLIFRGNGGNLRFSVDTLSGLYITPSQTNFVSLYSSITEDSGGGTHIAYQDGSQFGSASVTLDANPNIDLNSRRFGNIASDELGAFFFTEVIYYPSDQSANRAAIETNINNQYDIY